MQNFWNLENPILIEDFKYIVSDPVIPWYLFKNKKILITGATGLVGSLLVKSLLYMSDIKKIDLKIIASVRDIAKAEKKFKSIIGYKNKKLFFIHNNICNPFAIDVYCDYIIHTASITNSFEFINNPVNTILTIVLGTYNTLELSKRCHCKGYVYISSMEVYGQTNDEYVSENNYGPLDPLKIRNCYPQAKCIAESLCAAYAKQFNLQINIVRPTLTFGPGVSQNDNRVFMQFARSIKDEKNIILHTKGNTKRDYIYTADAIRGIISVLLLGNKGEAYNLSNPDTYMSIYDMAKLCLSFSKKKLNIDFDFSINEKNIYQQELKISLNTEKLDKINKFKKIPLNIMYERLLKYIN